MSSSRPMKPRFTSKTHTSGTNAFSETPPRCRRSYKEVTQVAHPLNAHFSSLSTSTPPKTQKKHYPSRHPTSSSTTEYNARVNPHLNRSATSPERTPETFPATFQTQSLLYSAEKLEQAALASPLSPPLESVEHCRGTTGASAAPKSSSRFQIPCLPSPATPTRKTGSASHFCTVLDNQSYTRFPVLRTRGDSILRESPQVATKQSSAHRPYRKLNGHKPKVSLVNAELTVAAVVSLYKDRIRPFLIDVLQRVKALAKQDVLVSVNEHHSSYNELMQGVHTIDLQNVFLCIQRECQRWIRLTTTDANGVRRLFNDKAEPTESFVCVADKPIERLPHKSNPVHSSRNTTLPIALLSQIEAELIQPPPPYLAPVDPRSEENPYSLDVWRSFCSFLVQRLRCRTAAHPPESQNVDARGGLMPYQFKGGRYGLAVELQKADGFPHLQSLSLGELCHLVQLAISARILAYERSVLQPVASCIELSGVLLRLGRPRLSTPSCGCTTPSHNSSIRRESIIAEKTKESTANEQTPRASFDTVEEVATSLKELLHLKPEGFVIAQLKRVLFARYGKQILPEKFGYHKLTECLRGEVAISSVCRIVAMDASAHRLLIVPRDSCKNSTCSNVGCPASKTPESPGSVSTTTPTDPYWTPESMSPAHPSRGVTLPEGIMDPLCTCRSISYEAWKHFKSYSPTTMPAISSAEGVFYQNEDDEGLISDAINVGIYSFTETNN